MPSNSKIFFYFLLAFIVGVAVATLFSISSTSIWLLGIASLAALAIDHKNRKNILVSLSLFGILLGIYRANNELKYIFERPPTEFQGRAIVQKVETKDDYQQIVVSEQKSSAKNQERILINTALYPTYHIGETIDLQCQLENPENKYEKFNYIRYLAKDHIYQICKQAKIKKNDASSIEAGFNSGNWKIIAVTKLFSLNSQLVEKIYTLFPQPEGAYLAGLLLGGSNRLPMEVQQYFQRTGTTHTVAVSGYNITIIAEFLVSLGIAVGLWRGQAFYLAIFGIILFVMLIGYPASAVRAALMGSLLLWAMKKGRLASSVRAIVFAGAIMTYVSPLILFYDIGFQLSFLASLGIVLIYAPLSEKLELKQDFLELRSMFLVTLSAQLGVFGIMLYSFETFSPISFVVNLLILPLIPIIMLGGMVCIAISFVSMVVAKIIAIPVWLMLHVEIVVVRYFSEFTFSLLEIKGLGVGWLIGYYIFFICLVVKLKGVRKIGNT